MITIRSTINFFKTCLLVETLLCIPLVFYGQGNKNKFKESINVEAGGFSLSDNKIGFYSGISLSPNRVEYLISPFLISDSKNILRLGAMTTVRAGVKNKNNKTLIVPIAELGMLYYEGLNHMHQFQKSVFVQFGYGVELEVYKNAKVISFIGAGQNFNKDIFNEDSFLGVIRISFLFGKS